MLEPLLLTAEFPVDWIDTSLPEVKAAVLRTEHGVLVLPIWLGKGAQFVPGQEATRGLSIVVPQVPQGMQAWEVTPGEVRSLPAVRVLGGTRVGVPEFGPARTKDLIFKARLVEAPEALALGLLNEIVPDVETLQRRADETARLVAGHAPITLEVTKEAVRRIRRTLSREEGEDLILRAYMSEDFREGMDAFLNKRTPNFKGK